MKNRDLAAKYSPKEVEEKWYAYWMERKMFHSEPDQRPPFCVVIPPPNVTGILHMGHMLNNTIQDVLLRRARMSGYNACWVPGTDHASIATEAKVVAKLKEEGIDKKDLSREEFLKHAWDWKEKHGGIILQQLKKLGASCDWDRVSFTMDEAFYESVIKVFVDLYKKGLIYRGARMVNWDPKALTAVSDEEVMYKEVKSKLYYLRYYFADMPDQYLSVATTRPETILGDTAVCVHPEDERYAKFIGKKLIVPLVGRKIPLISDEYVDKEFGTGCLKITPAHDINDYNLGVKHKLESIDIFNDNGTINDAVGLYVGMDRFVLRKKISAELKEKGFLEKEEEYMNKVGFSERTDEVIEPKLSTQWFLRMDTLAKPALDMVLDGKISLHPAKFVNTYRHWMENVKDWCISRQLWWGHRIPAYHLPNKEYVVAETAEAALEEAQKRFPELSLRMADLMQDEDVLDTWFSSWIWPIGVFDGIRKPDNQDIQYYYPTRVLVTAPEILFFWVARMIVAGLEYRREIPFKDVYLTGIVRDKLGRKMSKSLGNSPDPINLIQNYGADGVRVGMLLTSPAGNDLPFDEDLCIQGRNFCNKIWNAFRLVRTWEVKDIPQTPSSKAAVLWFEALLNEALLHQNDLFEKYRLSEALMANYKLVWDDFCAWYLEMIKPAFGEPIDFLTYQKTIAFFDTIVKVLHPYMPFITEEIWQALEDRKEGESLMLQSYPKGEDYNKSIIERFALVKEVITGIRTIRNEKSIPNKESLVCCIKKNMGEQAETLFDGIISKLCYLESLNYVDEKPDKSVSFIVGNTEYFILLEGRLDTEKEIKRIQEEIAYTKGFLFSVRKKLDNEKFVQGAPEQVVEIEKKKQRDAEQKLQVLEEQLAQYQI